MLNLPEELFAVAEIGEVIIPSSVIHINSDALSKLTVTTSLTVSTALYNKYKAEFDKATNIANLIKV
ncbi:hypothetical protein JN00_0089 [Metamycoplasma subdolum]|uniref:Uncharacterized protein n=1 Tax=Metamycoplasma subdolum TaxID=92407 RepID=A0A3M0A234_9BACT|nr:hypothetical protein JN00_0089 [Metamycoplasma subdolum]